MNFRDTILLCLYASLVAFLPPSLFGADVQVGDSAAVVQEKMGSPKGRGTMDGETILFYDRGKVILADGKVISVKLLSDDQFAAKKQRDEEERVQREKREAEDRRQEALLADFRRRWGQIERQIHLEEQERQRVAEKERVLAEAQKQEELALAAKEAAQVQEARQIILDAIAKNKTQPQVIRSSTPTHQQPEPYVSVQQIPVRKSAIGQSLVLAPSGGGMVIGGSMNGSILPGAKGGMVIGGSMNGSILPGAKGGTVIGGPMNGSIVPAEK
jgi:hypothetical protein